MTAVSKGAKAYDVSQENVSASGWTTALDDARAALTGRVAERIQDADGKASLAGTAQELGLSHFEQAALERILGDVDVPSWRVGEAWAECYLEDHFDCVFPWHTGRDLRNPNSSEAGADLVGLSGKGQDVRFAFGEVKSSEDKSTPPGVMFGRSGLIRQIERLCDETRMVDTLVRYLGFRHKGQAWQSLYRTAFKAYLGNSRDVCFVGVLVRTTPPHPDDLRSRAAALSKKIGSRRILLALYVPIPYAEWMSHVRKQSKEGTA